MNKKITDGFDQLVKTLIDAPGIADGQDITKKIDLLEQLIQCWRFENHQTANDLSLTSFLEMEVFVDANRIHVKRGADPQRRLPPPFSPSDLQPTVILYLLLFHKKHYIIYNIIEGYVDWRWNRLSIRDLEKTTTGVTRIHTNARLAARSLRRVGLLKYSQKEAHKTWVLSLPGFVVSSYVLKKWRTSPLGDDKHLFQLHPVIYEALDSLRSFDMFFENLKYICNPNIELFQSFYEVLREAYERLRQYRVVLADPKMQLAEKWKLSQNLITDLESVPQMEQFYQELSASLNIELFMESISLIEGISLAEGNEE